ncbi:MAG: hypothetical protein J1F35_08080 [Erysipelotrichales bacterium]|nr:hypothetical protein [Erysipelotrichales bacterium]
MKSLTQFIQEAQKSAFDGKDFFSEYYWKIGYKYYNKDTEKPTIEDIEKCYGTTSNVMGDPSFINIDGATFSKLKDNKWQAESNLEHVLSGSVNDKELMNRLENAKVWYAMLRFFDKKK